MRTEKMPELMTSRKAAQVLGIKRQSVHNLVREGWLVEVEVQDLERRPIVHLLTTASVEAEVERRIKERHDLPLRVAEAIREEAALRRAAPPKLRGGRPRKAQKENCSE